MVATVLGIPVVAVRDPAEPGIVVPAAATNHAVVALIRSFRVAGVVLLLHFFVVILTPFPDIPAQVVQAEFVGGLETDGFGFFVAVLIVPADFAELVAAGIFKTLALRTSTRGKFPLRVGWEAIGLASDVVELLDESLGVMPGDHLHRSIVTLEGGRVVVGTHHRFPQSLDDGIWGEVKAVQGNAREVAGIGWLLLVGTHPEGVAFDIDHIEREAGGEGFGEGATMHLPAFLQPNSRWHSRFDFWQDFRLRTKVRQLLLT